MFGYRQSLLFGRQSRRSTLWKQLRCWVCIIHIQWRTMPFACYCVSTKIQCKNVSFWHLQQPYRVERDLEARTAIVDSLLIGSAQKDTPAWRLGGTQTLATPVLTLLAGPSWPSSDSWPRTTGRTFSSWLALLSSVAYIFMTVDLECFILKWKLCIDICS